jgi:SNF2 family DNA or RNA helicase
MATSLEDIQQIEQKATKYFDTITVRNASKLLHNGSASISFNKGSFETFLVCSGIVKDSSTQECKFSYKSRLEGTEEGPLSSNCDCLVWTEEKHCPHVACLFMSYSLHNMQNEKAAGSFDQSMPPVPLTGNFAVSAAEYGTIIHNPSGLQGANPSRTYASFQYYLHNRKVVNFPIPQNLKGTLRFNVADPDDPTSLKVSYQDEEGTVHEKVSVFENLYLFNWETGDAFHLPTNIKNIVRRIKIQQYTMEMDELIRLIISHNEQKNCALFIKEIALEDMQVVTPTINVTLAPAKKGNLVDFKVLFLDNESRYLPPPNLLKVFTFKGGHLESFKKKKDAYEVIEKLAMDIRDETSSYKKMLVGKTKNKAFYNILEELDSAEQSMYYNRFQNNLVSFDNTFVKKLFLSLFTNFGELLFRFSAYDADTEEVSYSITSNLLFRGLSTFNNEISPYGLNIFYDKKEVTFWSSRVRFERRPTTTQWFDLEMHMDASDLQAINNADLDTNVALTDKGLVLFSQEQKNLLRFMKKYTQYEGKQEESEDQGQKKFILPFNRARIFELFELKKFGIEGALTPEEEELCHRLSNLDEMPSYDIPDSVGEIIRPYQRTGYYWLRFLYENKLGACLADDMGLGKTLQTITFIQSIIDKVDRILIACPVSILLNWENEFKKFSDLDVNIYHGGNREYKKDAKVVLTSYGVMKKEIDTTLADKHYDILILDEVQHLKNIKSIGSYAARKLKADFRICLTGTPVENDLAEFYNILDLSTPGIWGNLQFIRSTSNQKNRLLARQTARPFILRRTKSQVLTELPPKIENNVYLNFTDEEDNKYKDILLQVKHKIQATSSKKRYGEILKGLLSLRQSCLWQAPGATTEISSIASTKINFLMETLEQILEEGHQAIVFSQFTTYLDIIQNTIHQKHWKFSRIDGSQSIKKRQSQVEQFQEGKTQVFLISLKAGGVGLNLTAASYVFIMDPWWNPAVESQAIDRAHRIGQKSQLTVYRPIIKGSVEEKVLKLQEFKKELFYDLLPENDDQYFSGKLTMKDFEHLFS